MVKVSVRLLFFCLITSMLFSLTVSCGDNQAARKGLALIEKLDSVIEGETPDEYNPVNAMLILPGNPVPGESFRILATGGRNIRKARIIVSGPSGNSEFLDSKTGEELPCWRIGDFAGSPAGKYKATLIADNKEVSHLEFVIAPREVTSRNGAVWKTTRGWNSSMETIYSAWINALF